MDAFLSTRFRKWTATEEDFTHFIVANDGGLQSHIAHQAQPSSSRKQTQLVAIMDHARIASLVAQQNREVDEIGGVGRVGIEHPLKKTQSAARRIVSSLVGPRDERLAHEVGDEERDASG